MVKFSEYGTESKYLKGTDVPLNREIRLVIKAIAVEQVRGEGGEQERPVAYFQGKDKGLVLNVTNCARLAEAYGDDMEGSIGKPVILYAEMVNFQGQKMPGLRLRVPAQEMPADEEIPF